MSGIPQVGMFRTEKHEYFWNGQGPYPGVTAVLRIIDKPAIATWAKQETAKCAIRNWDLLDGMLQAGGHDAAVAWLSRIPDYQKDTAGKLGSRVHVLAEQIARGAEPDMDEEETSFVNGYRRFIEDFDPELVSVEHTAKNLTHGYGGTFDFIARINGRLTLVDIKTSKGVYPETALQIAAYASAEFIGMPNDPRRYKMPKLDAYAVLHVRPEQYARGYSLIPYTVGPVEFDAFLAALRLTHWVAGSKALIGEPIHPLVKEAVA
jgi:hypothetical protein